MARTITLTTDFGTQDAYVAAMKGVMLSLAPEVRFVDVTHEIGPQDIMDAAFVLRGAVPYFPAGTIHLAIVDPGVGTARRPVALLHDEQFFVGPDNGLFTLLLDGAPPDAAVVLDKPAFWRTPHLSATFHGRDLFAPAAAHLAAGRTLAELGTPIDALERLQWALPIADEQGLRGWVVHIDRFGNCITNITREQFETRVDGRAVKSYAGSTILHGLHQTYGAVDEGDPLLLFGSEGFLEVAVHNGHAAELLGLRTGSSVNIMFREG